MTKFWPGLHDFSDGPWCGCCAPAGSPNPKRECDMEFFIILLPMLMELLQQLQENKDEETLLRRMARPRLHEFRVVWSGLRENGLRGRELMATTREALEELQAMSRDDHVELLATARVYKPPTADAEPEE